MGVNSRILHGDSIQKTSPPPECQNSVVKLSGTFKGERKSVTLDESILSKHALLIGGTGCGKTTLFFHFVDQIKRKMNANDVMIIFDSKGDFYQKFGTQDDLLLGNSPQYINRSVKWNIFKEILADGYDEKNYIFNIHEICNSFFAERVKHTSNSFFPHAASELLAAIIITLIRDCNSKENRNNFFYNDVLRNLIDASLPEEIINNIQDYSDLMFVISYIDGEGSQSQGVLSELYSVVKEIFIGVFADHGIFSIRDFVKRKGGKTLFIEYDLSIGSVLTPVYSLLFDLALKQALGQKAGKNTGNVYLICDEFRLLPNLQHIDDGVNFGRSLGVKVLAGLQSINQLTEVYGEARGKNIAAGFSSVYAFRANDTETRRFIMNLFGENCILEQYMTSDRKYVEKERNGHTVEDWDLLSLHVGEAIVGLPFQKPFRFQFNDY